jgi:DNA modification methylase
LESPQFEQSPAPRRALGIEMSPEYAEIAARRLNCTLIERPPVAA